MVGTPLRWGASLLSAGSAAVDFVVYKTGLRAKMSPHNIHLKPFTLPEAMGKQTELPIVDPAGNPNPSALQKHGIEYCINGLEGEKDDDKATLASFL